MILFRFQSYFVSYSSENSSGFSLGCQLPKTISPDLRFWPDVWADLFYSIVVRLTKKWVNRKVEDELLSCRKCLSMPIRQCRHQVCDKATVFSFRTDFFTETTLNSTSLKTFFGRNAMAGGKTRLYKQSEGGKLNIFLHASVGMYRWETETIYLF